MCVGVYRFNVMDFLFSFLRLKWKFPLNLNGKFIFGAKLKEDFRFENQVSLKLNKKGRGGAREREGESGKQISCFLLNSNHAPAFGVNFKHHESIFPPRETYNIKVYEVEI